MNNVLYNVRVRYFHHWNIV